MFVVHATMTVLFVKIIILVQNARNTIILTHTKLFHTTKRSWWSKQKYKTKNLKIYISENYKSDLYSIRAKFISRGRQNSCDYIERKKGEDYEYVQDDITEVREKNS